MSRRTQHYLVNNSIKSATATLCGSELDVLSDLRQVLSRQGLHADEAQEQTLLELIYQSFHRKQCKNY